MYDVYLHNILCVEELMSPRWTVLLQLERSLPPVPQAKHREDKISRLVGDWWGRQRYFSRILFYCYICKVKGHLPAATVIGGPVDASDQSPYFTNFVN